MTLRRAVAHHTLVAGLAIEHDRFQPIDTPQFAYSYTTPGVFVQDDVDVARWLAVSASARLDHHSEFGTFLSPRVIKMWLVGIVLAIWSGAAPAPKTMKDLTFLTRADCVNTPDMVNNLDDALKALGWPNDYQFIDIGKLRTGDVRTGYPTPTLLWKGKDIFGLPAPKPPFDVPS